MLSLCCFCLCLLRGQDNDLSLVDGLGVHKTVGVALKNGLVLHRIAIGRLGDSTQRIAVSGGGGGNKPDFTQRFGQDKRRTLVDLVKLSLHAISTVVVQSFISFKQ